MTESADLARPGRGSGAGPHKVGRHPVLRIFVVMVMIGVPAGTVTSSVWLMHGALRTRAEVRPVSGWPQTSGTITGARAVSDGRGSVYAPIITFSAAGQRVTFSAPTSSDQPAVGSQVPVAYDRTDPRLAHDLADNRAWQPPFYTGLFTLVLGILATGFDAVVAIFLIRSLRRRGRAALAAG